MSFRPNTILRRVRGLPSQMHDLGEHLQRLSSRVRESVAEATGQTIAHVVKDILNRVFSGLPILQPLPDATRSFNRYDWPSEESDPWGIERSGWHANDYGDEPGQIVEQRNTKPLIGFAALVLHAGGWWLRQRGSRFGTLGLGLLFGGAALLGGRLALTGLGLFQAAGEILVIDHLLNAGGQTLEAV